MPEATVKKTNTVKKKPVTKRRKRERTIKGDCDYVFLLTVFSLLVIGIIMMFSASYAWAISEGKEGSYYASRQAMFAAGGLVLLFIFSKIDYQVYKTPAIAISAYVIPLFFLILVLIIGTTDGGAQRWINLGVFQFQPSELMKIGIVIMYSYLIERNYDRMNTVKYGIIPYMALLGVVAVLLMMQPHLSATIIISFLCIVLMFIGGTKIWHMLVVGLVGLIGIVGMVLYKLFVEGYGYFMVRIKVWLDPFSDVQGDSWQSSQSLIAIGSGGFFGLGLGESRQKYLYLPESKNDFVFSIVCEELGFVGALTVILLFVLLVFRGIYIAKRAQDKFGMLVAVGLTMHIGIQALLNIAVVSGFIMNTGISLPFFSYGGTALLLQLSEMGIVLNISRKRYKPEPNKNKSGINSSENNSKGDKPDDYLKMDA